MTCYHPLTGWRSNKGRDPNTGRWPVVFKQVNGFYDLPVTVPCGQCIGCRLERSRQWAIRCVHEASLYEDNCFITLTYSDENLPANGSLDKTHMTKFLKRLRKKYGKGIRYFQCGEYGEKMLRPHHHAIIFNFDFPDKVYLKSKGGYPLYISESLAKLWPYGYHLIGGVTFESAAYVARYILKKWKGDKKDEHYGELEPEYTTMSRRPGIAREWFETYKKDVYPNDSVIIRGDLSARPPKYYDALFDLEDPELFARIKERRKNKAKNNPNNEFERLEVREKVQKAKLKKLVRQFEEVL